MADNNIEIKITKDRNEITEAMEIRRRVFVVGQGIDEKLDFDGKDDEAEHIIAYSDGKPAGTLRIRYADKETAKLERLAVLESQRRNGIGKK